MSDTIFLTENNVIPVNKHDTGKEKFDILIEDTLYNIVNDGETVSISRWVFANNLQSGVSDFMKSENIKTFLSDTNDTAYQISETLPYSEVETKTISDLESTFGKINDIISQIVKYDTTQPTTEDIAPYTTLLN